MDIQKLKMRANAKIRGKVTGYDVVFEVCIGVNARNKKDAELQATETLEVLEARLKHLHPVMYIKRIS